MHRRELLAAVGTAATVGGVGGAIAIKQSRRPSDDQLTPVSIETLEAPGSEAGRIDVPRSGEPTVIECFATWCSTCADYMASLQTVHDQTDVMLVSVTNEPVGVTVDRATVVDWWTEHGGAWTVGIDADLELTTALDATAVPFTAIVDDTGVVQYAASGSHHPTDLLERLEDV